MIIIIDYELGNVKSVMNAFEYIGSDIILSRNPKLISKASGIVLPGVGAFGEGMKRLKKYNLVNILKKAVSEGTPILGICLGFQILMSSSTEHEFNEGLSLLNHKVIRLPVNERLPHIGWSKVFSPRELQLKPKLLKGIENEYFYFVHNYGVKINSIREKYAFAKYGGLNFVALMENKNIFGTQFHPEKSDKIGLQIIQNFLNL